MRITLAFLVLVAGTAAAQPAITPPYAYGTEVSQIPQISQISQISDDDRDIIEKGDIGPSRAIGGTLAAGFIGFGVGQGIEGRYGERGWIFTVADSVSCMTMFTGLLAIAGGSSESSRYHVAYGLALGGAAVCLGSRVWQVIDAAVAPDAHNKRYRAALARNSGHVREAKVVPYLVPAERGGGGVAGISMRF